MTTKDTSDRWANWDDSSHTVLKRSTGLAASRLKDYASAPYSAEGATARVQFARERALIGDMRTLHWAVSPYLQSLGGEWSLNEDALSKVALQHLDADICALVSHLMLYRRDYVTAIHLLERAIAVYEAKRDYTSEAEAYYWLAYIRLHQSDYQEAERCESKSIELIYQGVIQNDPDVSQPDELSLSQAIARARIGLGLLAHRQGLLTKAKAELYTARELLYEVRSARKSIRAFGVISTRRSDGYIPLREPMSPRWRNSARRWSSTIRRDIFSSLRKHEFTWLALTLRTWLAALPLRRIKPAREITWKPRGANCRRRWPVATCAQNVFWI
jgi:tetratricopeptide (TPR) repeat protein